MLITYLKMFFTYTPSVPKYVSPLEYKFLVKTESNIKKEKEKMQKKYMEK